MLDNEERQWVLDGESKNVGDCKFLDFIFPCSMFGGSSTGNGNGNKLNLRIEILEGLLASMGEGKNAKINSLKQTVVRNKTDMASDAFRSLDLMRRVFESEVTDELRQIIERHLRTTFSPALENLRRNGLEITEDDIRSLCRSMLEAAKKPYLCEEQADGIAEAGSEYSNFIFSTESDIDSEASVQNFLVHQPSAVPPRGRKRGRPPKTNNPGRIISPSCHASEMTRELDLSKWNPNRVCSSSQFILLSKVSRVLMLLSHRKIFMKYPSVFRYCGDEMDRKWLVENRLTTRTTGKIYMMLLTDAIEIASAEKLLLRG
ncbi:unnamed protein product [Thelazia callipaeda]|uniref:DNTTIP1_dimer domain-containing protein n=1 Tax=Thelazia callipaeda TaxID=103827 RepID=A0A0N5CLR2_THECL|nr:unnamed protein product [Thelazia callipaeda]